MSEHKIPVERRRELGLVGVARRGPPVALGRFCPAHKVGTPQQAEATRWVRVELR